MTPVIDFGDAINLMRQGHRVTRRGWNGKGMYLELQVPTPESKMQQPYIYISPVALGGGLVPWVASQVDMLAEDWELVEQEEAPAVAEECAEEPTSSTDN